MADQGAQGTAAATNTRYSTVPSRLGSQILPSPDLPPRLRFRLRQAYGATSWAESGRRLRRARVLSLNNSIELGRDVDLAKSGLPYRLRSSTPSDIWHFGRHDGHELDVGFER